tara:strand:+ start:80 stop:673 length:594 start_codon:yes stop_codon:yes gene_type:complete
MGILESSFFWYWILSGMLAGFLFTKADKIFGLDETFFEADDEGIMTFFMVISGLLGFVTVALVTGFFLMMIYGTYADNKMYAEHEKQSKINAEKRAIAAKKRKNKILENHQSDIQKLDEIKTKFEESPEDLNEKFFKDAGKLSTELLLLSKKDIQQKDDAISIIKFARINILNNYPENKAKEAEKIAEKLTKALKQL